jgi:hypothetical protein
MEWRIWVGKMEYLVVISRVFYDANCCLGHVVYGYDVCRAVGVGRDIEPKVVPVRSRDFADKSSKQISGLEENVQTSESG